MTDYKHELQELISVVIQEGASDLHLSAFHYPTIRVTGNLIPLVKRKQLTPEDSMNLAFELLGQEKKKEFLQSKEIDFSYSFETGVRFRGNAFFQKGMVGVALRLIPKQVRSLEELNLPVKLGDFTRYKQGFFLVVGPVGQGKSTTLASMVDLVNRERSEHIITIEDPVEYIFTEDRSIIDQREVGFDTATFHSGLKAMFREDVNVGMIGEMRDPETISTAVTAAETGHLVLSTLHTNNASQTIDRIIDSFPGEQQRQIRLQLSNTLIAVFSQRLVARISGGLIPAYELMINNTAIANLIREGRTHEIDNVITTGAEHGMVDMNHSLADLVHKGEISAESAIRHSLNPDGLQRLL